MGDAIRAIAVSKDEAMTERQLSAFGICAQIDPKTFAEFHLMIISNHQAKTTNRHKIIHGALLEREARMPICMPSLLDRNRADRLTRLLVSSDTSPVPRANTILNDHTVDDLATGHTSPRPNTVVPAVACPFEEIYRTHESTATMTMHPLIAFNYIVMLQHALNYPSIADC